MIFSFSEKVRFSKPTSTKPLTGPLRASHSRAPKLPIDTRTNLLDIPPLPVQSRRLQRLIHADVSRGRVAVGEAGKEALVTLMLVTLTVAVENEGGLVTVMISIQPIPAVRAGSLSLDDHGDPLPSPDAECGKAELFIQSIHTIEEGHEEPAAAGSNGMTQRHSAT